MLQYVYDKLHEACREFGIDDGGFFTVNSMRIEKAYRHWGHDIGIEDTPIEAGLKFGVAFDKPGGFIGREALEKQLQQKALTKRLVQFHVVEDNGVLLHHDEPIWMGGQIVGSITSGGYGHRLKKSFGMGYIVHPDGVTADMLANNDFEVEVTDAGGVRLRRAGLPYSSQFPRWANHSA